MSKDMLGVVVRKLVTLPTGVLGVVCDLLEKMSDPEWVNALKRFLRKENPWPVCADFPTWKVIELGTHKLTELRQALTDTSFRIGDWGSDILNRIKVASKPYQIELVRVTGVELGFHEGATRKAIYEKALSLGLQLCPAEVGPQLRRQYPDQPLGEWLLIAMEPMTGSGDYLKVFYVVHDGDGRWLSGYNGCPDGLWDPDDVWVFCRKSPSALGS